MNIFQQIFYYFSVYKKYIGRRLYIVFVLSALAAVVEGFGIAMLLPLMAAANVGLEGQGIESSGVNAVLQSILGLFGIQSSLIGIMLFIGFIFMIKGVVVFAAHAYQAHLQSQLMQEMKAMMFDQYAHMDYGYYCRKNTGHFVNIITAQITGLIASFGAFKKFLTIVISTAVYISIAFLMLWQFALMAMVAGAALMLLFRGLNTHVHHLSRKTASEQGNLNRFLVQTVQAFKYLSSTAELGHLRKGVMQSIAKLSAYMRSKGFAQAFTDAVSEPVAILFILLVIVIQVGVMHAPLAPMFVALVLFNRAVLGLMGIQKAWQQTLGKIGALEIVEKELKELAVHQERSGGKPLGPFSDAFIFKNVDFAYPGSESAVLHDISLRIPVNKTVAFVGESGAGKSTVVDMLTLLLRPGQGAVFVDGISGEEVDLGTWRSQIGYVSQETVVFDDTVANNIALWKHDYNKDTSEREQIEHAAAQAYADRFIGELPEGYNTVVGDRGVRLSGGQRQRLFLARELYKQPRLLILDEATSALDSESEAYIQQSIDALRGRITVVLIAHRLSTIRNADIIYVLEKGRIVEQGSYETLLESTEGRFSRMVALQKL